MRRATTLLSVFATIAAALIAGRAATGFGQTSQSPAASLQQKPVFRGDVNLVRIDAYARANGEPVGDLTASDFQVLEDGVEQRIADFEHIVIRAGTGQGVRVDPRNVRESVQLAGDPHNRLFVLFLDTFHVTDPSVWHENRSRPPGNTGARLPPEPRMGPPPFVDRGLSKFLNETLGPDDLIAAMTPEMRPAEVTFVRKPESITAFLATAWGRRFSLDSLDPVQEGYFRCYPPDDPWHRFDGVAEEMVVRQREGMTIQALRGLVRRLGEVREGRKGVLLVTEGWALFKRDPTLARRLADMPPPQPPGIFVGDGGKLASGTDPRTTPGVDWQRCEADRVRLSNQDDALEFRDLLDEANRANASFYAIDPRGLAVFDTPIDYSEINPPKGTDPGQVGRPGLIEDGTRLRNRLETLRTASAATDGLAMVDSNNLSASLSRIVADLSDYYLMTYYSTNAKADGTFRKIDVRVRRPGVEVRARRGYRAATAEEVAARKLASGGPVPDVAAAERALASLSRMRLDRAGRITAGYAWEASRGDGVARPALWITVELDSAAAREPEWREEAVATLSVANADGQPLWSDDVSVSPASRSAVRYVSAPVFRTGEYVVRVRLRGKSGSMADITDQVHLEVPSIAPGSEPPPGLPLMFRRGPSTGPGFVPTADPRFRRADRIRVDVGVSATDGSTTARLLDRRGQPLAIPVAVAVRQEGSIRFATAEATLAPLGPGDYLIELTVGRGQQTDKVIAPFRIVP